MSNNNLSIFADSTRSHVFKLKVFKPDGVTVHRVFSSDEFQGNSESSSLPGSKSFDAPPANLGNILSISLPENVIYSRQIINWPVQIEIISTNGILPVSNIVWRGRVNGFSKSGGYWNMEVVNSIIDIDKQGTLRLSTNCSRAFGSQGCGIVKQSVEISPTSISGFLLNFSAVPWVADTKKRYVILVGDTTYTVSSFISPGAGTVSGCFLDRELIAKPDTAFLQTSCSQSLKMCEEGYQNNAKWLGVLLPSSVLSLNL